jgi:hypothetical protein
MSPAELAEGGDCELSAAVYSLTRSLGYSRRAVVSASPRSGISLRDISAELAQRRGPLAVLGPSNGSLGTEIKLT